ncbi:CHASE2 domain-containing protein [bacterium SCSIO 12696]|nr:CHASE2 domain-containing protein [bacterium SCSIO 12696]
MSRYPRRLLIAVIAALLTFLFQWLGWQKTLDNVIYDTAVSIFRAETPQDIIIVAVDEKTLLELGQWPLPRDHHVRLLQQLSSSGVALVGMDILFAEPSQDTLADQRLAEQIQASAPVVLPVYIEAFESSGRYLEVMPMASLVAAASALGHVQVVIDDDGKSRAVFLKHILEGQQQPHFSVSIQQLVGGKNLSLPGLNTVDTSQAAAGFVRSHKNYIPLTGEAGSFPSVSYVDVLKGRIPAQALKDKIVLVGVIAQGLDRIATSLGSMPGVEVNANILNGLRSGQLVTPATRWLTQWLNVIAVALLVFAMSTMLVRKNIVITVAALAGLALLPLVLFSLGFWLPMGAAFWALALCFPLINWWRLSGEMNVLSRELKRLQQQDIFSEPRQLLDEVQASVHFLKSFYPLSGWSVRDQHFNVVGSENPRNCYLIGDYTDSWLFSKDHCLRQFRIGNQCCYLTLEWELDNTDKPLTGEQLNHVFPVAHWSSLWRVPGNKLLDESLATLAEANQRAERSNLLMWEALENTHHGVVLLECSGHVVTANNQAKELFGDFESGAMLFGQLTQVSLKNQANWRSLFAALVLNREAFSIEGTTADAVDLQLDAALIDLDRPLVILTIADVSELKRGERKRTEAINFLSHDLRSPMASVLALIQESRNNSVDVKDVLQRVEQQVERNISYADNYIQLSKIEANAHLLFTPCLIDTVLDAAVAQLFSLAKSRGIQFRMNYQDGCAWVNCDRVMLERAFLNLVDNAIKYAQENGVVTVSSANKGSFVQVDITDDGDGASEEDIGQLFDAFKQGTSEGSGRYSGVGLGLRLAATVIARHGGEIRAVNSDRGGLCVTVLLPLTPEVP